MNENQTKTETLTDPAPESGTEKESGTVESRADLTQLGYENADPDGASESAGENGASGADASDDDAPDAEPSDADASGDEVYQRQAESDLAELRRIDPEAAAYRHLGEMPGALRFAELRGLGLSVCEAYYAVRGSLDEKPTPDRGGRAHLHGSVPGRAAAGGTRMSVGEIESARRLFPNLSDRDIASLWRRVNEN